MSENTSDHIRPGPTGDAISRLSQMSALTFHKIQRHISFGVTNYSPRRFEALLTSLRDRGYSFWNMDESRAGERETETAGKLVLTFDDAYAHLIRRLPPLMERFGFTPILFVPTGWIGKANRWDYSHFFQRVPHCSEDELGQLVSLGALLGSHGVSHCSLPDLSDRDLTAELMQSKDTLETIAKREIDLISYPFGRLSERVAAAAQSCGYRMGFTMQAPQARDTDLARGRVAVYSFDRPSAVHQRIAGGGKANWQQQKAAMVHRLSGGTVLLGRLRRS